MNWMQKDAQTSAQMEIAWQCAPVLTGVKPSNILTLKNVSEKEVAESLKEMGISYSMLCDSGARKVWLIYREEEILEILGKKEYSEFLDTLGYRGFEFPQMLQIMNLRFEGYQNGSAEFPHELGIFLGYPLADVKGFIEHNGKDFLYQGYWKVYENVEERKKMFSIYNVVKEEFIREMQAGKDLWHAARSVRQPFDIQPA